MTEHPGAFWSALDETDRAALRRIGRVVHVGPESRLLSQGDDSDHLLVVLSGWIKVIAHSPAGYRAVLALRGPGDLLGEQADLERRRRSATLVTATRVDYLHLPAAPFHSVRRERPSVALALERNLSRRLRESDVQRAGLAEPAQTRLAALLVELATRCGTAGERPGEVRIELPLSQDDLAGLVLASRRAVTRGLERLRSLGWISTGRQTIVILAMEELKSEAYGS